MKIISYKLKSSEEHLIGVLKEDLIYNLNSCFGRINSIELIQINNYKKSIKDHLEKNLCDIHNYEEIVPLPAIYKPNSLRDAYAFREHVETCRKNRNKTMIAEFDEFPVFYFSNHNEIYADQQDVYLMPDHFEELDFELEFAIVISKKGRNILSKDAEQYIGGFCIYNDLSARRLQREEMKLNLGPAKGKDFANILGPYLVTPEEIYSRKVKTNFGNKYNLQMECYLNDQLISKGNASDMNWTFEEIIERASYGVTLYPGDVIGSGTVGTGCLLEINGTQKRNNENHISKWVNPGDEIKMNIEGLGTISNKIFKANSNHSILNVKK